MRNSDGVGYDPRAVLRTYDDMAPEYAVKFGTELADADPADQDLKFLADAVDGFPPGPVLNLGCGPAQVAIRCTICPKRC